jgi:hypothetical protein
VYRTKELDGKAAEEKGSSIRLGERLSKFLYNLPQPSDALMPEAAKGVGGRTGAGVTPAGKP